MEFRSSHQFLKAEFESRKKKNKRYSIRAFATLLKISSGRLHELLNGKHNFSLKMARRIAERLNFDADKTAFFMRLVESEDYLRVDGRKRIRHTSVRLLTEEEFKPVSDWEYFAIMALVETASFRSETSWIAKKLALAEPRVISVLEHLQTLGLLKKNEKGEFKNTYSTMTTLIDVPSEIVRKSNIACIYQGIAAIEKTDIKHRDISSLTLAVDVQQIPEVKALIREFKTKVSALMNKEQTTEVYNLNIQFVPVSAIGI